MNEARLMEFVGKSVTDLGALVNGSLIVIGDKLGLYKALAGQGSMTSAELSRRTGCAAVPPRVALGAGGIGLPRLRRPRRRRR